MPSIDMSLSWALCCKVFFRDKVRWRVAWEGLLAKNWLIHQAEFGYIIPRNAVISGDIPVKLSEAKQWACYMSHWTDEVIRINTECKDCLCALQQFDRNSRHLRNLFAAFFIQEKIVTKISIITDKNEKIEIKNENRNEKINKKNVNLNEKIRLGLGERINRYSSLLPKCQMDLNSIAIRSILSVY
jgi:hypothetical protein